MTTRRIAVAAPWVYAGLRLPRALCALGARAARWRRGGGEWVRPVVTPADWRRGWPEEGPPPRVWAVDFPPGADERQVREAGAAGRHFARTGARIPRRGAGAELRIALAKQERVLAAPGAPGPARWRWLPATVLPCGRLVVVARDDEFLAGVLASRWFDVWRRTGSAARLTPRVVSRFPLPWAPDMPRGALTRDQEEHRAAVVRAWRQAGGGTADIDPGGAAAEELAAAVAAAYGWGRAPAADEALRQLREAGGAE